MSEVVYYNVWRVDASRWTTSRIQGQRQDPHKPETLTLEKANKLCIRLNSFAWPQMGERYEVRPLPDAVSDQMKRQEHAMKYL